MQAHPTPYQDVNALLREFLARVQSILAEQFVGMYLYGSLALGDFYPRGSDIDYIVVTDADLSDNLVAALRDMHARFDAGGSPWAAKIEAAYIPLAALRPGTPTTARYPQLEKGRTLVLDTLESGWSFQCHTLREHGVVVAGPEPRTLIDPVDLAEMRREAMAIGETWREQADHDPAWLSWLHHRNDQAFVVLTLCRFLYTLDSGTVASKPVAARWAREALDTRWAALIDRSLERQHDSADTPDRDVRDTVALVAYTVEQFGRRPRAAAGHTLNSGHATVRPRQKT